MKKLVVSLCLLLGGLAIFVLGSPYYSVFPTNNNQLYYIALTVFFLLLSVALRKSPSLSRYAPSAYALFIASAALLFLSTKLLNIHIAASSPMQDLALDKLGQFLHVVPVVLALTLVYRPLVALVAPGSQKRAPSSGASPQHRSSKRIAALALAARDDLKSIFLTPGNLKTGLLFGGLSFLVWAILAYLIQASASSFPELSAAGIFYILVWVFANSIMEELWFRAIYLKKYQALVGRAATILVTSIVFGASHINATYEFPGGDLVFGIVVFFLGVVGAYSMFKTNGLLGAVLFHAGYDLMIIVPVLNSA